MPAKISKSNIIGLNFERYMYIYYTF